MNTKYISRKDNSFRNGFILLAVTIGVFFNRPTLPSEFFNQPAAAVVFLGTFLYMVFNTSRPFRIEGVLIVFALLTSVFWLYYFTVGAIKLMPMEALVKSIILQVCVVLPMIMLLSLSGVGMQITTMLLWTISILGYSSATTFALLQVVPTDAIKLTEIVKDHQTHQVLLPFSILYHEFTSQSDRIALGNPIAVYRFSCFFREAGICQAFAAWGLIVASGFRISGWFLRIGLWAAFVLSFSTATLVSFPFILITIINSCRISLFKRVVLYSVFAIGGFFVLAFAPVIGINEKSESFSASSIDDRSEMILKAVEISRTSLFGSFGIELGFEQAGICLISESILFGLIGLILACAFYLVPIAFLKNNRLKTLLAVSPLLVTSLTSQPMGHSPLTVLALAMVFRLADEDTGP